MEHRCDKLRGKRVNWTSMLVLLLIIGLYGLYVSLVAAAEKYPVKPIVMTVPYAAGGSTDLTGRIYANALSKVIGQTVVVENRSNSVQGMIEVGKARPDGYTLGLFGTGGFTLFKYLVPVYPDPANFEPVVQLAADVRVLAVSEMSGFKSVKELMDYGRKNPKMLLVGINPGTTSHLDSVTIMKAMGIEANYIPFKSGGERAVALAGGHLQVSVDAMASLRSYVDAKKVRILGVAAPKRVEFYKEIPTLIEQGINATSLNIEAIFVPKGVPNDVLQTLEAGFEKASKDPELVEQFNKVLRWPDFLNRKDFAKGFTEESARIETVAKEIGLAVPKK